MESGQKKVEHVFGRTNVGEVTGDVVICSVEQPYKSDEMGKVTSVHHPEVKTYPDSVVCQGCHRAKRVQEVTT